MSKAAKRRARKHVNSVRQMQQSWEAQAVVPVKREPDPRTTVLSARCRMSMKPDTEAARLGMTWPGYGDPAGRAIAIGSIDTDERDRLWDTFKRLDAADDAYARRYVGINRFPNVAKMEMLPEAFETSADEPLDTRTPEQRDRDAVSNWMRWQGLLGRLSSSEHTAVVSVMRGRVEPVCGRILRASGEAFVQAMRNLHKAEQGA